MIVVDIHVIVEGVSAFPSVSGEKGVRHVTETAIYDIG
jgi:hypothetical protein